MQIGMVSIRDRRGLLLQELSDIREGGLFGSVYVEPDECREFLSVWSNGAVIEIQKHESAPEDVNHPDDRILFRMVDQNKKHTALWINAEDAKAIIFGLQRVCDGN